MSPAPAREPEDARPTQAQFTADLLCLGSKLRTARRLPQLSQEQREQRLERIRRAVANGTYKIDSASLSKVILRRKLL